MATTVTLERLILAVAIAVPLALTACGSTGEARGPDGPEGEGARPMDASTTAPGWVDLGDLARRVGGSSGYDAASGRFWMAKDDGRIELSPDSRAAYIEGELALMKEAPRRQGDRLLVPDAFAEKLASWAFTRRRGTPHVERVEPAPVRPAPVPVTPTPARLPLAGLRVVIDPGHGGKDPGKVSARTGPPEKELVLEMSREVERLLKAQGAQVLLTRTTDVFIELRERADFANRAGADLFVSLHANAAANTNAQGIEVFRAVKSESGARPDKIARSAALARAIYARLEPVSPHPDRGVKPSPGSGFQVLRYNDLPAVLVELGFLTNARERALLHDPAYRKRLAAAVAAGIADYAAQR